MKESRHANFGAIQAIFLQLSWSQHKLAHSCQGRGQRSNGAINRNIHLFRSFCRGISNVGYSLSNSGRVTMRCRLAGVIDLVAVDARYHLKCYVRFLRKHTTFITNSYQPQKVCIERVPEYLLK